MPAPTGLAAVARGLTRLTAEHAGAVRLPFHETVVAGCFTGGQTFRLTPVPALYAVTTPSRPGIIADESMTCCRISEAASGGLSGIRRTTWATGSGATGDTAMTLPVAHARVAHLAHVPGIGRVDFSIRCPFRGPCFRTVTANLAGTAAG
jgi:hypothetical protein